MKILLIHPSNAGIYKKFDKKGSKTPPIGLMYLAGVLEKENYPVEILDAEAMDLDLDATIKAILAFKPDIIGITVTTPLISITNDIAKKLKEVAPEIEIVLGGPHISALPKETLKPEYIDYVVCGEGDYSFLELVRAIESNKPIKNLKGIGYKYGKETIIASSMPLIANLDELPFPAHHLVPLKLYNHLVFGNNKPFTLVVSSRGCPFNCIFCGSSTTFGRKYRFRSPTNVVDELEYIVEKFDVKQMIFGDDAFTLNKRRTIELCKDIIERELDLSFMCSARVDTIDEERMKYLERAGCCILSFGVESGEDRILKNIKKGITTAQAIKAIELAKKFNFKTHATYMIGNPGETTETIEKTLKFSKKLNTDIAQFTIATPFPGTELWDIAEKQGKLKIKDFSEYYFYYNPVYETEGLTAKELMTFQKRAYEEYKNR